MDLEELRTAPLDDRTVRALGARLPDADADLDALLARALDERDDAAFERLCFAAIAAGRPADARHLVRGAVLLDDPFRLAAFAWHCTGDVAASLLRACSDSHLGQEREAIALVVAAAWCNEHPECEVPASLASRARILARSVDADSIFTVALLCLRDLTPDEGLRARLARLHTPDVQPLVDGLSHLVVDACRNEPLRFLPGPGEAPTLSGYTVRRAVPRIGRNQPCPCGSGRKYKRCCYAKDRERLRRSSDVAGVTLEELRATPESYLSRDRLLDMRPHELARLDPGKVGEDLLSLLAIRLENHAEHEALVRLYETHGLRGDLEARFEHAVHAVSSSAREDLLRRLLALRPSDRPVDESELGLAARLVLAEDPLTVPAVIEEHAVQAVGTDHAAPAVEMAHDLLASRYPALGVLVARGVLPIANPIDAEVLLESVLEARDRLDLPPDEPLESLVDERLGLPAFEPAREEAPESDEMSALRERLEEKNRESRRLREEIAALRVPLEPPEATSDPSDATPDPTPAPGLVPEAELDALRSRLASLKSDLHERHRERNRLRRELAQARKEAAAATAEERARSDAAPAAPDADAEEALLLVAEDEAVQPIRIPSWSRRFRDALARVPHHVAQSAMVLAGRLAAGDPAAHRGVRRLRRRNDVRRQRVGSSYRLLFRQDEETIEVLDLVSRQDLERTIRSL